METIQAARRPFIFPLLAAIGIAIPAMGAMLQPSNHPDVYVRAAQDTVNIETALNEAAAAGPGAVVELAEGTFYVSRPIAVRDFDGTFKGQGIGVTTLRTIGDDAFPPELPPLAPAPVMLHLYFLERAADPSNPASVAITDMTLRFVGASQPYAVGSPPASRLGYVLNVGGRMSAETVADPAMSSPGSAPTYLNCALTRVEIAGATPDATLGGVQIASWVPWEVVAGGPLGNWVRWRLDEMQPSRGSIHVSASSWHNMRFGLNIYGYSDSALRFDDIQVAMTRTFALLQHPWGDDVEFTRIDARDARVAVQAIDSRGSAVRFTDSRLAFASVPSHVALWMDKPSDSLVTMNGLALMNGSALAIFEDHSPAPSTYRVFGNDIVRAPNTGWGGIEAHGTPTGIAGDRSPLVEVQHNRIRSQGHRDMWSAVFAEGIDHLAVSNNAFSGTAGVATMPAAMVVMNGDACRLVNNDTREFATPGPKYYLEDVNDCLIGAGASAGGVDSGQVVINGGDGNRIEGVNPAGFTGPGFQSSAASAAKRSMLQSLNDD